MDRISENTDLSSLGVEEALAEAMEILQAENGALVERLQDVARMFAYEDRGWDLLIGYDEDEGPTLDEIKEASKKIRELMVGNPTIKRGAELRASYVWSKGINLGQIPGARQGRGINVQAYIDLPVNQRNVFSAKAHQEMERCAYSDGIFILLGDNSTRELRRIPIREIVADLRNPDFNEEIWAYQRSWTQYDENGRKLPVEKKMWYYTDQFTGKKVSTINNVPVDKTQTIMDIHFNGQVGWAWGVPDAITIVAYARLYREFLSNGAIMSRALAQFAFKLTTKSNAGNAAAAAKVASPNRPGSTAAMTEGMSLDTIASAGKGYDFNSGRPLAAMVATGIEVSLIHLLSDPGAAGSSYGSAATLDMPTKRAMVFRQEAWKDFYNRILKWMGVQEPNVRFPELDDVDPLKALESLVLGFNSGAMDWDEFRPRLFELLEIESLHESEPDGALLPNNEKSLPRKDIDTDSTGGEGGGGTTPTTGVSPRQGRSNGVGGTTTDKNRNRTDKIS